ncbi:DEAD/DEAH box helicase [Nonomuraea muscovyensis]|uniref:DEAD/DEAH box helicase n=1 Tax=Nonomuraea muscovyensis TaxID=1124761 RepID=UPI003401E6FD
MDVFKAHDQLINDYDEFTRSLVWVRATDIREHLDRERERKARWPDPWISLNPTFRSGGTVAELVDHGVSDGPGLHHLCKQYFRDKTDHEANDPTLSLYFHQREAIEAAASNDSYVLTTGTGSGKSLSYLIPIVDSVLKEPNPNGISAIVVYPMNALANSQMDALRGFLHDGVEPEDRRVSFERYTGQEDRREKESVLNKKPDILLTNYMMLEYLLTRPAERRELIEAARGLRFLVLDELHTYRGRQGADVALLVRRLREACQAPGLRCIGTSATMSTSDTFADAQKEVAAVATRLFGTEVKPHRVIGETLQRATDPGRPWEDPELERKALAEAVDRALPGGVGLPTSYLELSRDPLAVWIEGSFGLDLEPPGENGNRRHKRRNPITIPQAAKDLHALCGRAEQDCREAIVAMLQAGAAAIDPRSRRPLFAFRLHQFLSKGDTVYTSLQTPEDNRHLTSQYQLRVPGKPDWPLVPLNFCRECGHDFMAVTYDSQSERYFARKDPEAPAEAGDGYLYVDKDDPWPTEFEDVLDRIPASWVETDADGQRKVIKARSGDLPVEMWISPDGRRAEAGTGMHAWWIEAPFRFCPRCRVGYEQPRVKDFVKLATFSAEGRSSAVSLVSASVVRSLRAQPELKKKARKLLTFVDNRQDASLQAGHFNDFAQVTQIRGALFRALDKAGAAGLRHDALAPAVFEALNLPSDAYARVPGAKYQQREDAQSALRSALAYRLYADLERGWRLTMPNLSQTGLLRFDYTSLAEIAADEELWGSAHWILRDDDPVHRQEIARTLLDELRRGLAINEKLLSVSGHDRLIALSDEHLVGIWAVPRTEPPISSRIAFAGPRPKRGSTTEILPFSARGGYGRYLRQPGQFGAVLSLAGKRVSEVDADAIIHDLLKVLRTAGLLDVADDRPDGSVGYQLRVSSLIWLPGDGARGEHDPVRRTFDPEQGARVNPFFRDLYKHAAEELGGLEAREHTAQVETSTRQTREEAFRDGDLQLLYCSPTMELGVDIKELNAVTMRNVPPTPANYAQRNGRAGRSGQPALVTTYCSTGSAHDQYYFRRPQLMVSGSVVPPRIDLTNEDLLRSHVHAVWLAETGVSLGSRMTDVINISAPNLALPLHEELRRALASDAHRRNAITRCDKILAPMRPELASTAWWHEAWVADQVGGALRAFDEACERWRRLYRNAYAERDEQDRLANDTSIRSQDRRRARARRVQAEQQLDLLRNDGNDNEGARSDFYTYRYFASEGFLPGYSFPRLPLAAYVPGEPGESRFGQKRSAFIQRPRFIAIGEFGPGALIYHEGRRYTVSSVQIPPGDTPGRIATIDAKLCSECGYWHDRRHNRDECEHCGGRLKQILHRLMQLSTVNAEPKKRISSDEEERLREPFQLRTAYRFDSGELRARFYPAGAADPRRTVAEITYGEASIQVINLGRRGTRARGDEGFNLDPVSGRWLTDRQVNERAEVTAEQEALGNIREAVRIDKVVPYVEDSKNIAVFRVASPVDKFTSRTLRYALERGIEAQYQLEDSELNSEDLPDPEDRARMLFVEGAEGGAGVLRLLHDDREAIAAVARKALEIIHYELVDGEWRDAGHAVGAAENCEFGCYDCLLTYHNQFFHPMIRRQSAVEILKELAGCEAVPDRPRALSPAEHAAALALESNHQRGKGFVEWLRKHGYRLPDATGEVVESARATPDFIYRRPDADVAVFLDLRGAHPDESRDLRARNRLENRSWLVIAIDRENDEEWHDTVREYPNVFGPGRTPQ